MRRLGHSGRRATREAAGVARLPALRNPLNPRNPRILCRPSPRLLLDRIVRIEREVELEDVDARLTKDAELPSGGVGINETPDIRLRDAALTGHTRNLEVGCGRRDMRIDPGGRRRHKINGHRGVRILLACGLDVGRDGVDQLPVGGPELAACRISRVVARSCGRRPRPKVAWRRESLPDDPRSNYRPIALDQLAIGLIRERDLRDGRDRNG
jgi:hypothetical protein